MKRSNCHMYLDAVPLNEADLQRLSSAVWPRSGLDRRGSPLCSRSAFFSYADDRRPNVYDDSTMLSLGGFSSAVSEWGFFLQPAPARPVH